MEKCYLLLLLCTLFMQCNSQTTKDKSIINASTNVFHNTSIATIHVFVALCDNQYQGIVPVPSNIGNGQNPNTNLYWGCKFGLKTFFKNSNQWQLIQCKKKNDTIIERLLFKHKTKNIYLIADAYNGKYIAQCTNDFLQSLAGQQKSTMKYKQSIIGINGNAKLCAYIGHNGLMDFNLQNTFKNADDKPRDCILLACHSKKYFAPYIASAKANALLWTSGLMCPEAYTLHDALDAYCSNLSLKNIRIAGAKAYSHYQKCSQKAAENLLVQH